MTIEEVLRSIELEMAMEDIQIQTAPQKPLEISLDSFLEWTCNHKSLVVAALMISWGLRNVFQLFANS